MALIKNCLLALALAAALLGTLIYIGSIDTDGYDDLNLLAMPEDLPDKRNGYLVRYCHRDETCASNPTVPLIINTSL